MNKKLQAMYRHRHTAFLLFEECLKLSGSFQINEHTYRCVTQTLRRGNPLP